MNYNGQNLFNAYVESMWAFGMKRHAFYNQAPNTELLALQAAFTHQEGMPALGEILYFQTIVAEYFAFADEHDWDLYELIGGWQGQKHWDLWNPDWHYLCKNEDDSHWDGDGWFCYDADMLYWMRDGWYCEFCVDDDIHITTTNRGRSLAQELRLAKERGKCYRPLPTPVTFGNEWRSCWHMQ